MSHHARPRKGSREWTSRVEDHKAMKKQIHRNNLVLPGRKNCSRYLMCFCMGWNLAPHPHCSSYHDEVLVVYICTRFKGDCLQDEAGRHVFGDTQMEHIMDSPCSSVFPQISAWMLHPFLIAVYNQNDILVVHICKTF
jgi:hypothetical protein